METIYGLASLGGVALCVWALSRLLDARPPARRLLVTFVDGSGLLVEGDSAVLDEGDMALMVFKAGRLVRVLRLAGVAGVEAA